MQEICYTIKRAVTAGEQQVCWLWCSYVCQSVSGAAPEGRLGLFAYTLTVAVLTVVLPWLQLQKHKENKG